MTPFPAVMTLTLSLVVRATIPLTATPATIWFWVATVMTPSVAAKASIFSTAKMAMTRLTAVPTAT
jgi:hypothetical protein